MPPYYQSKSFAESVIGSRMPERSDSRMPGIATRLSVSVIPRKTSSETRIALPVLSRFLSVHHLSTHPRKFAQNFLVRFSFGPASYRTSRQSFYICPATHNLKPSSAFKYCAKVVNIFLPTASRCKLVGGRRHKSRNRSAIKPSAVEAYRLHLATPRVYVDRVGELYFATRAGA